MNQNEINIGDVIGGFKIEKELGRGSMGVVYLAHELSLNRKVALKVLSASLSANVEFLRRFKREAQIIAALNHPNIVSVLSYGEQSGHHYFAMQYISGKDLGKILQDKKKLSFEEALYIIGQVAEALAEASGKGIVHRDIKPSNIMLDNSGRVQVTDFGIAHFEASADKLTQTGLFIGTPEYASPEQANGRPLDIRSDIFSLGAVLYRIVAGKAPFSAASPIAVVAKIATEEMPPIRKIDRNIPEPLCKLIDKMTERDLNKRFQTTQEVLVAITHCSQKIKSSAFQDSGRKSGTVTKVWGGILGVGLIILLSVFLTREKIYEIKLPEIPSTHESSSSDIIPASKQDEVVQIKEGNGHTPAVNDKAEKEGLNDQESQPVLVKDQDNAIIPQQHFFWKPFGTQKRANGFAEMITKSSGVPCKVKSETASQHRIFFDYENEQDRADKIAKIEKKAGVRISVNGENYQPKKR